MRKITQSAKVLKNAWLLYRLDSNFFFSSCSLKSLFLKITVLLLICFSGVFAFFGCQSIPVRDSKDLSLKLSISGNQFSVAALVFIKEENVRVDILRPFSSPFGSLYIKGEQAVFLFPGAKKYYQGTLNKNTSFFPPVFQWFEKLSVKQFISILKGEIPNSWNCLVQRKYIYCKLKKFEVFLKSKNVKSKNVILKFKNKEAVKIKIRKLPYGVLKKETFSYDLTGWQSVKKWEDLMQDHPL